MARPLRLEYIGALYYVTSRGDQQEDIWLDNQDRLAWPEVLGHVCQRFNWVVHAYCQMTNHYQEIRDLDMCAVESHKTSAKWLDQGLWPHKAQVSDTWSSIAWLAEKTPYGITVVDQDPDGDGVEVAFNMRFPGQYFDKESGLHYNYHRYYDPNIGRYLTADPLGVVPDPTATLSNLNHLYVYANNNPVNFTDPYGLLPGMPWPEFGPWCGTGNYAGMVPDGPFKDACKKHDKCYATCGKTKEQCDLELCTNGACLYGFLLDGMLSGPSRSAYDKAQKESGCDDCNK